MPLLNARGTDRFNAYGIGAIQNENTFPNSYLLYERCARVTTRFRRSNGPWPSLAGRLTGG